VSSLFGQENPATLFHTDKTLPADYGVRLATTPSTQRITDPFGEQHLTGGGMRYEIYQNGQMVTSTPVTPDSEMDIGFLHRELSKVLTQLGCH